MLKNILPQNIYNIINRLPLELLCEIRLRVGKPIVVNIMGENKLIGEFGFIESNDKNSYNCSQSDIQYILKTISNNSLYTIIDQLINGYVTFSGGIRIGVAGEIVSFNNQIKNIKNITSLNIRIPHNVKNCSLNSYMHLVKNGFIYNTLVLSPAGAGKTTFIRDFCYQISNREKNKNILIVDERNEITGINNGVINLDVGNVDVYSNCKKKYAFENGIRSMKPDVIVTDELNLSTDIIAVENAITSGVKVIATAHANSIEDIKNKPAFENILAKKLFDRFVLLGFDVKPGVLKGIYNENLSCISF